MPGQPRRRKGLTTALVVGAGPAGASAALGLLGVGMNVTVLESRPSLGPRVCGAFLDAEAISHLATLGLIDKARAFGVDVGSVWVSVGSGKERVLALPAPGLALSRPEVERLLLDAVVERGGKVRWGIRAQPEGAQSVFLQGCGLSSHETTHLSSDWVVWADGRYSGKEASNFKDESPSWFGWNGTFKDVNQTPGEMSLHFLPDGYVGLLTFKDGTSNLCGLKRRRGSPLEWGSVFDETMAHASNLKRRMRQATLLSPWRGVGPLPFTGGLRPDDGLIRVGDAAAVGDPFMGEGIGRALGSGPLLAQAWALHFCGNDSLYATFRRLWRTSYGRRFKWGNILRWSLNHPEVSARALNSLLVRPGIARFFLPLFHGGFKTAK